MPDAPGLLPDDAGFRFALPQADELHIAELPIATNGSEPAIGLLSRQEMMRADQLTVDPTRRRFVFARVTLRRFLGAYLGQLPEAVTITAGPQGKPQLHGDDTGLTFNLSHADGRLVFVFGRHRPVGVDIARRVPCRRRDKILARFFAEAEHERISRLPPDKQDDAFLALWTRAEATVKASGGGIWATLRTTRFLPPPGDWVAWPLDMGPDYVGSVVTDGRPAKLIYMAGPIGDNSARSQHHGGKA
ncbi:MAG: 4'-phosphopantetheinyl transferase superfamily protein [Verrucomicrobia bacterium]|nr:4'-phosphopantetheinyl transferase superfamily protein [Verrucomicrobiota bacterium]